MGRKEYNQKKKKSTNTHTLASHICELWSHMPSKCVLVLVNFLFAYFVYEFVAWSIYV